MKNSNIGKHGNDSIRINGMEIGNLPLGQGNEARDGLAEFLKTEKDTMRNNIAAKFPKHKLDYIKSQVQECKMNIKKIKSFKTKLKEDITEYRKLISDCNFRDKEMAQYDTDNPDDAPRMKELRLKYPPYDIEALNQQITQFEESIERCDEVIEKEYNSVNEIQQTLILVEQREKELRNV